MFPAVLKSHPNGGFSIPFKSLQSQITWDFCFKKSKNSSIFLPSVLSIPGLFSYGVAGWCLRISLEKPLPKLEIFQSTSRSPSHKLATQGLNDELARYEKVKSLVETKQGRIDLVGG